MHNLIELLPGEHLSGFVGRLHSLGLYESMSATTDYLQLNSNTIRPHRYFHADDITLHHLFKERGVESAWFDNGFGNYIWPFLKPDEQDIIIQHLSDATAEPLDFKLRGLHATHDNQWRWCYACADEDYQQYGTSYYHRDHQLPGVFHCHRHNVGLSSCCSECGFMANEVKHLTTPPTDNTCPVCGDWLSSYEGYFSDSMINIEKMSLLLANSDTRLHLDQFTKIVLTHIGIDQSDIGTLKGNKAFSAWTKNIGTDFDQRALMIYFCNLEEVKIGITSPLFNHPRLYNSSSPRAPLHPLMHLIALDHAGFDVNNLSRLIG